MFGFGRKKKAGTAVIPPVAGKVVELSSVPDPLFGSGKMGPGFGVEPTSSTIVAPVDGELIMVAKTAHAFGIKTKDGAEVLVHIGVDTVGLKGDGFTVLPEAVKGAQVSAGTPLIEVDFEAIKDKVPSIAVLAILTNTASGFETSEMNLSAGSGETVFTISAG